MEEQLSLFYEKLGFFSDEERELLGKEIQERTLSKGDLILREGEVCSSACLVISGSLFQYQLTSDHEQQIIDLYAPSDWVMNHKSFISRKPSSTSIAANEESRIYELSIDSVHKLIALSQNFLQMGKILEQTASRIDFFDNHNSADEKYEYILTQRPALLQKFPLTMLASYLKIKPETLSRVRRRLT